MKPESQTFIVRPAMTAALMTAMLGSAALAGAAYASGGELPGWRPSVTEKLVKLPNSYLKKSLDKDFGKSPLAGAIRDVETEITLKARTLGDLRSAAEQADDDLKVELDHQFLAEKKAYLDLVSQSQDLKRRHLTTRVRLYERVLKKINRTAGAQTKTQAALVEKQVAAQARFERAFDRVDLRLFEQSAASGSKYAREYAKNLSAIKTLAGAIKTRSVNRPPNADGAGDVSKTDFIRQLMTSAEGELALLDQEREIVGYMARLVVLDARALAERMTDYFIDLDGEEDGAGVAQAVDFFIQ